jgi:hypothetical protein
MNPLHWILRRGHCRCTHQYFAFDALPLVQTAAGRRLVSWLLRYYPRYLRGAIDPDIRYRDFQNQVIHVNDGYWGGAPRVAHQWYDRLQRYLRQRRYSDAAHAAGVLSHYFTDPLNPLNTAYSPAEAVIHRPLQWSVDRDYAAILRHWQDDHLRVVFQFADGPGWLGAAMLHGAKYAHGRFDTLVRSYRLEAAVEDPTAGLTPDLRVVFAELFGLAITGWARVLERAAKDAEAVLRTPLPTASSLWPTITAAFCVPGTCWRNHIRAKIEDLQIKELVDEFRRTGELQQYLPAAVDIKRRVIKVYRDERRYRLDRKRREAADNPIITPFPSIAGNRQPSFSRRDRSIDALALDPRDLAQLRAAELATLKDLQAAPANKIAAAVPGYWITAAMVAGWQRQAALMTQVPALSGIAAMMFVGAGFPDAESIAAADEELIVNQVAHYANTLAGRRGLRGQPQPTGRQIDAWRQQIVTGDSLAAVRQWKRAS